MEQQSKNSPIIRVGFTTIYGDYFPNVREIAFKKGDYLKMGIPVASSHGENSDRFISDDHLYSTMYIYQDSNNPYNGFRIYGEYANPSFNSSGDAGMISRLQEKQGDILLTKFPTGVVTRDGYVIGQEIPFYPNSVSLDTYLKGCNETQILELYKKVLLILKELYLNRIIYTDIHPGNFMVMPDAKIELIDFDSGRVHFEKNDDGTKSMILNLYIMINYLTYRFFGVKSILPTDKLSFDFDNIMELLETKGKQLVIK